MYNFRPRRQGSVSVNRQSLKQGYWNFNAEETTQTTGGGHSTHVILTVEAIPYTGDSGGGHAEMKALNYILIANGDSLEEVIAHQGKNVSCTEKPCCYRCSIVLGLLGFRPANTQTKKTKSAMGATQWVLPDPLAGKIKERYGDIVTFLSNYSNVDKL